MAEEYISTKITSNIQPLNLQDALTFIQELQLCVMDIGKQIGTIKDKISQQDFRIEKLQERAKALSTLAHQRYAE